MSKITLVEQSVDPAAPSAGNVVVYAKTNNAMYYETPDGVTHQLQGPAVSAGSQSMVTGTAVFANSNGISFGMSGSSQITASYTQSTAPSAVSAGSQSASSGPVVFANSNGVSFGMSGSSQVTASVDAIRAISAGAATASGSQVVFANSNGISFGVNGQTVTAQMPTVSRWYNEPVQQWISISQSRPIFNLVMLPFALNATREDYWAVISASSSAGGTITAWVGAYTMSGSTASLASSTSRSYAFNSTLAGSSYTDIFAGRIHTFALGTWNMTPGNYLLAHLFITASALTALTFSYACPNGAAWPGALEYGATSAMVSAYFNNGLYTAQTSQLPNSVQLSEISQNFGNFLTAPVCVTMVGTF